MKKILAVLVLFSTQAFAEGVQPVPFCDSKIKRLFVEKQEIEKAFQRQIVPGGMITKKAANKYTSTCTRLYYSVDEAGCFFQAPGVEVVISNSSVKTECDRVIARIQPYIQ